MNGVNASYDAIVLGAGIVGVSVASHLQDRGWSVALIDRRGPGEETSHGNAGLIELSAVVPHPFPRGWVQLAKLAANRDDAVRYDALWLPRLAPWLLKYWLASRDEPLERIGAAFRALLKHALADHEALMREANAAHLLRRDGWLEICRSAAQLDSADRDADGARRYGIAARRIDAEELRAMEPALLPGLVGALHWSDTFRVTDPGALVRAYADAFVRKGGALRVGDAATLRAGADGWRANVADGELSARHAVVALGPWSDDLIRTMGYRLPLAVKRGYHRHYAHGAAAPLERPVYVRGEACLIVPMRRGLRLMTGVELAARDAPPRPIQLTRLETRARQAVAMGQPVDETPWLGARPCTSDMLPVIGAAPRHRNLWFAFGHGHYGLTLGPATGRLLADMMTGQTPFVPTEAYRVERFDHS